ncbi:type IV toxin-antitoxin system AbiEi family antitoxin domain-containing protein [Streptomyces sp. NPDC097595]|uniref:type IV toxin-antitoxin system AbiEi family antitoxin domain-containing protein n=1 Tax=Streptomyces sp. NPDC097595 TaxID=3366090 RepID=UPI00382CCCE9
MRAALAVLAELRSLALGDEQQLTAAEERLVRAEKELAAARTACSSAQTRAEVSRRVAQGVQELLGDAAQPPADRPEPVRDRASARPGPAGAQPTMSQEILGFARTRGCAFVRREIARHLGTARPDLQPSGLSPELTRLVRTGELVRPSPGVYSIPAPPGAGDA